MIKKVKSYFNIKGNFGVCITKSVGRLFSWHFLLRSQAQAQRNIWGPLGFFLLTLLAEISSQTEKLMADTKISDYLGLKHYKAK